MPEQHPLIQAASRALTSGDLFGHHACGVVDGLMTDPATSATFVEDLTEALLRDADPPAP